MDGRRERVEARLKRASFRLEMAQLERTWAVVSAHRDGCSVRDIATNVGLSPTRVHQLLGDPGVAMMEHVVSGLRELGWPAPEDPHDDDDETVAARLTDEAALLLSCAEWVEQLAAGGKPVINLRPTSDGHDTDNVLVDHSRVLRIIRRIADDIEELARVRRVADVSSANEDADRRLRRRRRLAEPPIESPKGPMSVPQARRAWEAYERRLGVDLRRLDVVVPEKQAHLVDRHAALEQVLRDSVPQEVRRHPMNDPRLGCHLTHDLLHAARRVPTSRARLE
jgi:hypothetical protein